MKKNIKLLVLFSVLWCFVSHFTFAQIAINTDNSDPDASAILDIKSSEKGMLIPRMATAQRIGINAPATGLLVFDTDIGSFWFYNGIAWVDLSAKDDADANATNELQTLNLTNTNLSISDGNTIDLSSLVDGQDWVTSSGTNITNSNEGHVGIGNMAPTQNRWQLTVKDTVDCMIGSDTIDVSELFTVFARHRNENNTGVGIGFQSTSTVTGMGAAIAHERTSSNSRGKLHFATKSSGSAANEDLPIRMTLDETGDLGIGTTSPSAKLEVVGNGIVSGTLGIGEASPQASLDVVDQAVIGNVGVGLESTDQSSSNHAGDGFAVTPWLYTNAIEAQGERGGASTLITIGADGTHGSQDQIHFVTNGNAQMTIANDGNIGIDKKSPQADLHIRQSGQSSSGSGGILFEESGDVTDFWRIYHSGIYFSFNTEDGRVSYITGNGAYTVDSDLRLKKNVRNMPSTLNKVQQMRPVQYHYKKQKDSEEKVLGFIAQEVQPLFPEMVVEGEDGHLGMTYSTAGVIAIKAIQEQQEIIEQQAAEIEALKKSIAAIQKALKR